ncbi:MAG: phosphotransferase [Leptospira sp.]|nr:phosphotransferase [Leptospira sp.]
MSLEFYRQIEEEIFQSGRSIRNLNSKAFEDSIKNAISIGKTQSKKQKTIKPIISPEPKEIKYFLEFYNRHQTILELLNDFFLIKLSNIEILERPKVLFLCDSASLHLPLIKELMQNEEIHDNLKCIKHAIEDVSTLFPNKKAIDNYLCLLIITPNLNTNIEWKGYIEQFLGYFDEKLFITIKSRNNQITLKDYNEEPITDKIVLDILNNINKVFYNKVITNDQQRLIKSFFQKMSGSITYRLLNPGASGASVIEVQGTSIYGGSMKRYVVKIAQKTNAQISKLSSEIDKFKEFVKHYSTIKTTYSADYHENETLEAIFYNYASAGSLTDALPFANLLTDILSNKGQILNVTTALLNCELFNAWKTSSNEFETYGNLYRDYIKNEKKIREAVAEIDDKEVILPNLFNFYDHVIKLKTDIKKKICHGDLHTDNFFYDGNFVTLIDFGFTGNHHAIIDHVFLEASIRFKHFPKYIPISELIDYENKFSDIKSFKDDFNLDFIKRPNLKIYYEIISLIRKDSLKYLVNQNEPTEYLLSLFLISFRQIQYPDLNQIYALRFSDALSKIIKLST